MEITVIFHYANPLIGVHLSLQVAGFFRFIASILLLVIVIFEVRAQYLADAWICKKGISFGKRIIAFFSFYIIPTLYVFVGKGTCASFFQCLPRATFCPTPGSIPFIHACWLFQRLLYVIAYQATFFLTQTSAAASVVATLPDGRDPQLLPGKGTVLHLVWYRYRCYGVFPCHTSPPGSCRAWVEHFKEPGPGMLGKRSIFFQLTRSFSLRVGSDDAAKTAVLPSFCSCTVIRAALASGLDRDQLLVVWKF